MNIGAVVADARRKALRQRLVDFGKDVTHGLGDIERIGNRLLDDAHRDGRLAVVEAVAPLVGRAKFDARHLAQFHLMVVDDLDDDVAELLGRDESRAGQDRELAVAALDAPGGQLDVLNPQRGLDILNRQIERGQPLPVDPDPHRVAPLAEDGHIRDAGEVLQPVDDEAVDIVRDL